MCKLWPHLVGWMATQRPAAHPHQARHLQPCQEVVAMLAALLIMRCEERQGADLLREGAAAQS